MRGRAAVAMAASSVLFVAAMGTLRDARADEGEIQLLVAPTVALVQQDSVWHGGAGLGVSTRYGVPAMDWLAVEFDAHWSRLDGVSQQVGLRGRSLYDAQRFGVSLGLLLRRGGRVNASVGGGLGYRYEFHRETASSLVSVRSSKIAPNHRVVAAAAAAVEWRFVDRFSVSLYAAVDAPGTDGVPDVRAGLALGVYTWPNLSE